MCVSPYNGIRMQAETWARELERQGHIVTKVNPWEMVEWEKFDAIHVFGFSGFLSGLQSVPNTHIMFSPIIDSFQPIWKYKLATYWGSNALRLTSHNYEIRSSKPYISRWCVRTRFEYNYVRNAYGVQADQICLIPLSYRVFPCDHYPEKKEFCLHVSKITDGRKNVERLVDAAIKYKFELILAGSKSPAYEKSSLKRKIEEHENIKYLGRVSEDKLYELYCSAKVFALPSIGEGVGLVALEAAVCGCDIVVTKIGGPKEYYDTKAFVVDPYDIDSIGHSIMEAMAAHDRQPMLMYEIRERFSLNRCVSELVKSYKSL